jgi:hypothetical protein
MKINQAKTAFKIADIKLVPNNTKLNFKYLKNLKDENNKKLSQSILRENVARVYLIVVDDEIKKIGGSQADGGIKQTLEIYRDGGIGGRPSIRSFGIWYFLYSTMLHKHKIEFYMIFQSNFEAEIKGLFGYNKIKNASYSYKIIENCCMNDYLEQSNGEYPPWNVQEQAGDWPAEIKMKHSELMKKSLKRKQGKGRKQISQ